MGNIGQNYSLHSITSAYNTLHSNNSVEKHTSHPHDYTNLAGKTKTFTCDWCSGKYEGEPAYRCSHNHFWGDKKFCSYECKNSHWSSEHM
jgi:uncharacterized Zn-finger protein